MNMDQEYWMLVKNGIVQITSINMGGRDETALIITRSQSDAMRLARCNKSRASPARIGTVQNETLEGVVNAAIGAGANYFVVVTGWDDDGQPVVKEVG